MKLDGITFAGCKSPDRLARLMGKFRDWKVKGRIHADSDINCCYERARFHPIHPKLRSAIAWVFGVNDPNLIWIKECRMTENFTLVFLGFGGEVLDMVSFRGLRGIERIHWHWSNRIPLGRSEAGMLRKMSITKFMSWQQGGLIRGKLTPRITGKCKLSVKK